MEIKIIMGLNNLEILKEWVENSNNIVFFGGAGVSTESDIPDFRSVDGLYNMKFTYPPEEILSHSFYINHMKAFYQFYRKQMLYPNVKPNMAHIALSHLEKEGKVKAVITQNVDGLHQKAGSKKVLELHGSVHRNYCNRCGKFYDMDFMLKHEGIPHCICGGVVKPDVVLYGEDLDWLLCNRARRHIKNADVLIVAGTSLTVYPAAEYVNEYRGNKLVVINKTPVLSDSANLIINQSVGQVMSMLIK